MSELLTPKDERPSVNILGSDGTLRKKTDTNCPEHEYLNSGQKCKQCGTVRRDYETADGKKGTKYELVFKRLEGVIVRIEIFKGDFGKNLLINVEKNDEKAILSLGVASPFGEDFMKKFPNIDLGKEISFEPFSFENDNGKTIKGITLKQDGEKLENHYFDKENKKAINGVPEPEGDTEKYDSDDWKGYFLKVRKFLLQETEKVIENIAWKTEGENNETF